MGSRSFESGLLSSHPSSSWRARGAAPPSGAGDLDGHRCVRVRSTLFRHEFPSHFFGAPNWSNADLRRSCSPISESRLNQASIATDAARISRIVRDRQAAAFVVSIYGSTRHSRKAPIGEGVNLLWDDHRCCAFAGIYEFREPAAVSPSVCPRRHGCGAPDHGPRIGSGVLPDCLGSVAAVSVRPWAECC
jgi:hypothetical protein